MSHEYDQFLKAAAERRKTILRLSRKGMTQGEIAAKLGMSRQRVHQIVKKDKEEGGRNGLPSSKKHS